MAKFTKLTKKTFLNTYEINGGSVTNACEVIKVSRVAYYKSLDKDPKFKQDIEDIREKHNEELVILARKGLKVNLVRNKQSAIEYVLNNKTNGEYSNTTKNELTGAGGSPLRFVIEKSYPDNNPEKKDAQD